MYLISRAGRGSRHWSYATLTTSIVISKIFATMASMYFLTDRDAPLDCRSAHFSDPESLFSCGEKIPLVEADMYALELIPGISDQIAINILSRRKAIRDTAEFLRPSERFRAFELADGVGDKIARTLAGYIEP